MTFHWSSDRNKQCPLSQVFYLIIEGGRTGSGAIQLGIIGFIQERKTVNRDRWQLRYVSPVPRVESFGFKGE